MKRLNNKGGKDSAFAIFLKEYRSRHQFNTDQELLQTVDTQWKRLPEEEREKYYEMANESRRTEQLSNLGIPVSEPQRQEKQRLLQGQIMQEEIREMVEDLARGKNLTQLIRQPFYILHINNFVRCSSSADMIPAELALARFSLEGGCEVLYHTFTDICPFPRGYGTDALQIADKTHKIPRPKDVPKPKEEHSDQILFELRKHLNRGKENAAWNPNLQRLSNVPMFTCDCEAAVMMDALKTIIKYSSCPLDEAKYRDPVFQPAKVYSLEQLLYNLARTCQLKAEGRDTWYFKKASCELEKDPFAYSHDIACDFHEREDNMEFCSRSFVTRWSYVIAELCCPYLQIELVEGFNCAYNTKRLVDLRSIEWKNGEESEDDSHLEYPQPNYESVPVYLDEPPIYEPRELGGACALSRGGGSSSSSRPSRQQQSFVQPYSAFSSRDSSAGYNKSIPEPVVLKGGNARAEREPPRFGNLSTGSRDFGGDSGRAEAKYKEPSQFGDGATGFGGDSKRPWVRSREPPPQRELDGPRERLYSDDPSNYSKDLPSSKGIFSQYGDGPKEMSHAKNDSDEVSSCGSEMVRLSKPSSVWEEDNVLSPTPSSATPSSGVESPQTFVSREDDDMSICSESQNEDNNVQQFTMEATSKVAPAPPCTTSKDGPSSLRSWEPSATSYYASQQDASARDNCLSSRAYWETRVQPVVMPVGHQQMPGGAGAPLETERKIPRPLNSMALATSAATGGDDDGVLSLSASPFRPRPPQLNFDSSDEEDEASNSAFSTIFDPCMMADANYAALMRRNSSMQYKEGIKQMQHLHISK